MESRRRRYSIPILAFFTTILIGLLLWPELLTDLLSTTGFEPHGFCFQWRDDLLTLHVTADTIIGMVYMGISAYLLRLTLRYRKTFGSLPHWIALSFAGFIFFCGMTHFLGVAVLWWPAYWLDGAVKALTALASIGTYGGLLVTGHRIDTLLQAAAERDVLLAAQSQAVETLQWSLASKENDLLLLTNDIAQQRDQRSAMIEKLQRSEERFAKAFHVSPTALTITREDDGTFYDVNPSFCALIGYTREELIGHTSHELGMLDLDERTSLIAELQQNGRVYSRELTMRKKNGETCIVLFSTERIELDSEHYALATLIDITERKQAEEARGAQAARMEVLTEASRAFAEANLSEQGLLDTLAQMVCDRLGDGCGVLLLSDDGQSLFPATLHDVNPESLAFRRRVTASALPIDGPQLPQQVVRSGQPLFLPTVDLEAQKAVLDPAFWEQADRYGARSMLMVPIRSQGEIIGVLSTYRHRAENPRFTEDDLSLLLDLADRAGLSIAKARLYAQAAAEIEQRKQMEATLIESQDRLSAIVSSAMDAIISIDDTQRIVLFNAAAERVFGYTAEDIIGQTIDRLIPERFRAIHRQHITNFSRTGVTTRRMSTLGELFGLRATGEEFPIEAAISQVAIGEQKLYTVILRDITTRKQAEDTLKASERRYAALIEHTWEAIALFTIEGQITYASPSTTRILGYDLDEFVGHSAFEFIHEDDAAAVATTLALSLEQPGVMTPVSARVRHKNGEWRLLEGMFNNLLDDEAIGAIVNNYRDVTEQTRAAQRLAGVIDSAMDAIITVDAEQHILIFNHTAEQMFGYTAEQVMGQQLDILIPERLRAAHQNHIRRFGTTGISSRTMGSVGTLTLLGLRADGTEFPIEASISQLGQDSDKLYTAIVRDVTHSRRLEQQFLQAQKMEVVGRLAGGVAHDFNNLLTAILGTAELLEMELGNSGTPQAISDVQEIQRSARRSAQLTKRLLTFARQQILELRVINLNDLIVELGNMLRRLIGENIELAVSPGDDLDLVHVDPSQVEQVIVNLVVNAKDAMPDGGRLTIETQNVELDETYMRQHAYVVPGQYVMLAVTDTGTGMPTEVAERVFEPFYTTKEKGKGTGLGLPTCYGVLKQHRGYIWIYSEVGRGTSVKCYFPVAQGAEEIIPEVIGESAMPRGTETILLVEDEPAVRAFAFRVLTTLGYTVLEASNGEEALMVMRSQGGAIDLLITDVVMPLMGGTVLAERMRAIWPRTKILFISGYTDNTIVHHGILEPGLLFLQKPFSTSALSRMVRSVLDERV